MTESYLLREGHLTPGDAAVALIVLEDGRYHHGVTRREAGFFIRVTGACSAARSTPASCRTMLYGANCRKSSALFPSIFAISRNIPSILRKFEQGVIRRYFYEARLTYEILQCARLAEGQEMRAFNARDLLEKPNVTPYDAFAVWMHARWIANDGGGRVVGAPDKNQRR